MAITYHAGRRIQGLAATGFNLTGLKAYWKMNEASGNLINQATTVGSTDSLGTAADSTTVANLTYSQTGKVGNAISWNGTTSSSYAEVGTSSLYDFMHSATAIWSFNFWYKKTAGSTSFRTILANNAGGAGATGTRIAFYNGSFYQNIIISNAVSIITDTSTAVPNDTNWHMITMTVDLTLGSNDYNCYVDGVLETTVSQGAAGTANNAQRTMRIGDDGGGDGNHYGLLDEMSIWSRVLTSAEITSLYNTGSGKEVTELTSKPTNVQLGSRFEETDTRKMYHYANPLTFEDDFSDNLGWVKTGTKQDITGGKLTFTATRETTLQEESYNLGSALSTTWVCDFDLDITTFTSGGSSTGAVWFGLSSVDGTTSGSEEVGDYMGLGLYIGTNTDIVVFNTNGNAWNTTSANICAGCGATDLFYVRMIRDGDTITINFYPTDADRTAGTNSEKN